jgi:hypothetical protein
MSAPRDARGRCAPPFWVSRRAARGTLIAVHAAALAVVGLELLHPSDGGHGVERPEALEFLGSYGLYGFVSCVLLVLLGRGLRRLVMRDERYYEREP